MNKNKISIISLAGLGNSLLTALALSKTELSKNQITIYVSNDFAKSIFQFYLRKVIVRVIKKKNRLLYFAVLQKLIFSKNDLIIIEPNSSSLFIGLVRLFFGKKVKFCYENNNMPIEQDYKNLFSIKSKILDKVNFKFNPNDKFLIYPTVESINKFSKKISEIQLSSIIDFLNNNKLYFDIIIPNYEKNQISLTFIKKHVDHIKYIDTFSDFKKLINFFKKYDAYIGGDTFYYHLMAKTLQKKSFTFFGSTNYKRFIYENELTKYFYPDCPHYPTYKKYFSKIKYCNYCKSNYCIDKINIKNLNIY